MARTPDQFLEEMKTINPDIKILENYTKATEPVLVKCLICGKEWQPKAYSLLSGKGCPHCSSIRASKNSRGKTGLKDNSTFIAQMKNKHPDIKVLGKYINTHSDIECECLSCGNKWTTKPYSLLQGHGCPRCAKSGTSFMEQLIYLYFCNVLGENKVLSRDRQTIGMELDIVIPDCKIAIEPGNWLLHKRSLERDAKKRDRCHAIGYRLFTIYDKYQEGLTPPFDKDCYVYSDDLNKADHSIIRKLITDISNQAGIKPPPRIPWTDLEKEAYDNARAKIHEDFINEMKTKMPTIKVLGRYFNANRRIKVKCQICGFEWDAIPANIVRGDGCRKCGAKVRGDNSKKSQGNFENELKALIPSVKVIGTYTGRHKPITVKCLKCGNIWSTTPGSLLRKDHFLNPNNNGCPKCAMTNHHNAASRKKVINLDTGEIFNSATDAGRKFNTHPTAIRQCCRGISNTSNGYHWAYYDSDKTVNKKSP